MPQLLTPATSRRRARSASRPPERWRTRGAPIDAYGVGTKMGVSADAPYLDTVYKLVAYAGRPVMKLSAGKETLPGAKQVFRCSGFRDVIGLRDEQPPAGAEPLLQPVMRAGQRVGPTGKPGRGPAAIRS